MNKNKKCKQPLGVEMAKYFPCREDAQLQWDQLRIHDVGKYSISRPEDADEILRTILNVMQQVSGGTFRPEAATIIDGTACVGGDSISFAQVFKHVMSVERDPQTFQLLTNNLKVYGLSKTKVTPVNTDVLTLLSSSAAMKCDVLYMDPPWNRPGQPWHSTLKTLMLYLGDTPIDQVVKNVMSSSDGNRHKKPHLIVVKCPGNFDVRRFMRTLSDVAIIAHRVKTFLILICINPHFLKQRSWDMTTSTKTKSSAKSSTR